MKEYIIISITCDFKHTHTHAHTVSCTHTTHTHTHTHTRTHARTHTHTHTVFQINNRIGDNEGSETCLTDHGTQKIHLKTNNTDMFIFSIHRNCTLVYETFRVSLPREKWMMESKVMQKHYKDRHLRLYQTCSSCHIPPPPCPLPPHPVPCSHAYIHPTDNVNGQQ